jgi:hypothetical protein
MTYPNLFELPKETVEEIEKKCRTAKHLGPDENLLTLIEKDAEVLKKYGLKKEDIAQNHQNMQLKFNLKSEPLESMSMEQFKEPEGWGNEWACWRRSAKRIMLNGEELEVGCFVWGGAEECPIEKHFSEEYHGYQRGDRDWFIQNKEIFLWVPDLIPSQVGFFGFFQGHKSEYRLDPVKYIKIMGLDKTPMEIVKTVNVPTWTWVSLNSSLFQDDDFPSEFLEMEENEHYKYVLGNDKYLWLNVKNYDWLKQHGLIVDGRQVELYDCKSCKYREGSRIKLV